MLVTLDYYGNTVIPFRFVIKNSSQMKQEELDRKRKEILALSDELGLGQTVNPTCQNLISGEDIAIVMVREAVYGELYSFINLGTILYPKDHDVLAKIQKLGYYIGFQECMGEISKDGNEAVSYLGSLIQQTNNNGTQDIHYMIRGLANDTSKKYYPMLNEYLTLGGNFPPMQHKK